jgi:hypothetical protein
MEFNALDQVFCLDFHHTLHFAAEEVTKGSILKALGKLHH